MRSIAKHTGVTHRHPRDAPSRSDQADTSGKLADVPLDALVPSLQVNLLSALYLLQPALPHLRASASSTGQPSRVVFVSSGAASTGYQAWGMYSMNKAGLNSFARTLATEERASNVAFYAVRPGVVDVSGHGPRRPRATFELRPLRPRATFQLTSCRPTCRA